MLAGKSLIDFPGVFSPYDFKKNDDIMFFYFKKVPTDLETISLNE